MNRGGGGGGYSTPRGRGRQQQSWRKVTANSSFHPVGVDVSSNGRTSGSSDKKPHSPWQAVGRGSGGGVSKHQDNVTPMGRRGQRQGWSTVAGESYSSGGRAKQWGDSPLASNGSEFGHDKKYGISPVQSNFGQNGVSNPVREGAKPSSKGASESSSLDLDRSFLEHVDHRPDVSRLSEESDVGSSHVEAKGPESAENVCDDENSESSTPLEQFDICPPKSGSVVTLKPSLLTKNREKRNDMKHSIGGPKGTILRSGMVLLKNYLSSTEQVNILRICRNHGLGPAGFYQPRFRDGGKLHLKLMCFGEFWDPETSKYGELRPMDRAKPPSVPQEFLRLVDRAIKDSHSLIAEDSKVKNVEHILPPVKPDICLVNYYATTGRLGLHQDKDEGRESLGKGIPIVSFSIGDSAEFLYSDQRDAEKAEKIRLETGDVLIFGGKSRHIFHGVSTILPDTAPKSLLEETNFRPGRINLTFRQHL